MLDTKHLKGDIYGGITAAVVAIPLALAFGVQSGLGAEFGLYGSIILGIVASLAGGTPTQISGPTGPMTVVSALVVANAIKQFGGLEVGFTYILATFLLAGLLQMLFGVLKFGSLIKYIPYPIISGFMSGVGVIIIMLQVFPSLGHSSPSSVIDILRNIQQPLSQVNSIALVLSLSAVLIIYILPRFTKIIPSSLVALLLLTALNMYFKFEVPTIGDIPSGLPDLLIGKLNQFDLRNLSLIIVPALTLAALGSVDSLLGSVVADNITKMRHDSNRELFGQGLGNALASFVGGIPGAGATMRTLVNIDAGGRTRLSGFIYGMLLLAVLLLLGPYASQIPMAVLAGILITVGINIIDYKGLSHLFEIPRYEAFITIVVLLLTVFVNLLQAVGVGMILATFFFMKKMSDIAEVSNKVASIDYYKTEMPWSDDKLIPEHWGKRIYIKHLRGPLFFGFVSQFKLMVDDIPDVCYVIIRMAKVPFIDQSGLYALEDSITYLNSKGVTVLLSGVKGQPHDMLQRIMLIPSLVPENHVFKTFTDCVNWLVEHKSDYKGE